MLKIILVSFMFTTFLCGCATVRKTYTSDGKEGYVLNCSGSNTTWGRCYEKAGEICGTRGYDVLEKIGETLTSSSGNVIENHSDTDINRNLIIKCK